MKKYISRNRLRIILTLTMALILGALGSLRNLTYDSMTGQAHLDLNWIKLLLIALLSHMTMTIHFNRKKFAPHYGKTLLCGSVSKKRILYLDYVRVAATVMVIGSHTVSAAAGRLSDSDPAWLMLETISFLCQSCNLLFVMVSGALLLTENKETLPVFYLKRVTKVALPMVLYYFCYLILLNGSAALKPDNWGNILNDILHGSPNVPHFWLLYIILFLYVVTPLIRIITLRLPDKGIFLLSAVFLVLNGIFTYLPLPYVLIGKLTAAGSWITVFLFGYLIHKNQNLILRKLLIWGGGLSFVYSFYIILQYPQHTASLYHTAPTMILISAAIFSGIKKLAEHKKSIPAIASCISRYSFSILLIHWYLLFYIVEGKLHLNGLSFSIFGGVILTIGVTLILSLCFAFIFDNTVLISLEAVIDKFFTFRHRTQKKFEQ